ncbi:hypothetical protein BDZ91DRAFT_733582 [Kalaharituber pfeilii]|nr:hypothetical protein BDZ91DRAFT_733582 [Kalaharituber pfeilii]
MLAIQYLTLVLVLFVQPILGDSDTAIDKSSDVWAALIANIAPLLILVGEKHVKAYFKVMSRNSHYLLYAAGPIGLITAVTTLIRLNGTKMLKRLIGRQFETRAEVLADVTSVTAGEVYLELKNGNLEQTTNPDPKDWALFYVHGKQSGTGKDVLEYSASCDKLLGSITEGSMASRSAAQYTGTFWWTMVASFRAEHAQGDAVEETRSAANIFLGGPFGDDWQYRNVVWCEAGMAMYAAWTDVSLNLTASHCLDNILTDIQRLAVAFFCTVGNIGVIVANWMQQHNVQNTVLVCLGLAISATGSFITARLVDEASEEKVVDLSVLQVAKAGFYSPRMSNGNPLSFCPNAVVMSTFARMLIGRKRLYITVLTNGLVVLMALGYVALYLGLRTSKWWASLAILCCSAVASIARAWFIPDRLELVQSTPDGPAPFPFSDPLPYEYERWNLFFKSDTAGPWPANSPASSPAHSQASIDSRTTSQPPAPSQASIHSRTTSQPPAPSQASIHSHTSSQPRSSVRSRRTSSHSTSATSRDVVVGLLPVIIGPNYETIASRYVFSETMPASYAKDSFLAAILDITLQLRKNNLVPVELTDNDLETTASLIAPGWIIYSDLLCTDGVWRQPLEIMVSVANVFNESNPIDEFLIPLKSWFWRAMALRKRGWAKQIIPVDLQAEVNRNADEPLFSDPAERVDFQQSDCVWMGAKIAFVVFSRWTTSKLEQHLAAELDAVRCDLMDERKLEALVGCMRAAGLAVEKIS